MLGGEIVYEGNLFTLLSMATNYWDAQLATNRHPSLRIWYKDPLLGSVLHQVGPGPAVSADFSSRHASPSLGLKPGPDQRLHTRLAC